MNEFLITNVDNSTSKTYGVYYTNNERYYVIYTEQEKDENGYVVLHIAKVLKEVNSTPDGGVVPTGRFIGLEISEQAEWDSVKGDIGAIVSNLQTDTPVNVNYLPVSEISGISIKSSKTFKLRDDVVSAIIKETNQEEVLPVVDEIEKPEVEETTETFEPEVEEEPVVSQENVSVPSEPSFVPIPEPASSSLDSMGADMPTVAPNPFEFKPLPMEDLIPKIEEEPKAPNPYEELQKQRDEEMINNLATEAMQDIVPEPVLSVDTIESNIVPEPEIEEATETFEPVVEEPLSFEVDDNAVDLMAPEIDEEPIVEEEPTLVEQEEPVVSQPEPEPIVESEPEEEQEIVSSESFVDSIVADVTDILDPNAVSNNDDNSNYKQLYHDELEKTIELEKELRELHTKLNNIKNIIE